jgi:hypothetical protein
MSTNNGIEVAPGITVTKEQAEQAFESLAAVNMDEVTIERIRLKVRHYKLMDILDDDGNPVLDEETGQPLKARKALVRTAEIQNFVPTDLYHQVISQQGKMQGANLEEAMAFMDKCVLRVWQISEPWFTAKMLDEGVDIQVKAALFHRFFDPNRLQRLKV